ncbi:MAG: hypothetical protein HYY37_04915 [Candidatus Aenigmarchaeota archaeon]|nr:hypothetical protein [Candidatus Aenigmarchaeota archaeon]
MEEELLIEIKKAEERAKAVVEDATKQKDALIREAEQEAARFRETEAERLGKQMDDMVGQETAKIIADADAAVRKSLEESKKIRSDRSKEDEARRLLKETFDAALRGEAHVLSRKDG